MRHLDPQFRANQRISCDFVPAGVIKGLRFEGEPEFTALQLADTSPETIADICKQLGISRATYYRRRHRLIK